MRARVTVNNAAADVTCGLAGLGLIHIPADDVQPHPEAGQLVEMMPDHPAAPMPMFLLHPNRQPLARRPLVFAIWPDALMKRDLLHASQRLGT